MPIIIILGILAVYGVVGHAERDRGRTYTRNETHDMLCEMIGKSQAEKRQILKRYRKGRR